MDNSGDWDTVSKFSGEIRFKGLVLAAPDTRSKSFLYTVHERSCTVHQDLFRVERQSLGLLLALAGWRSAYGIVAEMMEEDDEHAQIDGISETEDASNRGGFSILFKERRHLWNQELWRGACGKSSVTRRWDGALRPFSKCKCYSTCYRNMPAITSFYPFIATFNVEETSFDLFCHLSWSWLHQREPATFSSSANLETPSKNGYVSWQEGGKGLNNCIKKKSRTRKHLSYCQRVCYKKKKTIRIKNSAAMGCNKWQTGTWWISVYPLAL